MKLILKNSTVKIDDRIKEMDKAMKEVLNWVSALKTLNSNIKQTYGKFWYGATNSGKILSLLDDDIKFYQSEANEVKTEIEKLKRMQKQGVKEVNV